MVKLVNPDHPVMAIYGGTFDPFHNGHAAICQAVLNYPQVTQIRLVPCYIPALKAQAKAPASHRLAMLHAWQQAQVNATRIAIDAREMDRGGPSYTIETVDALIQEYSGYNLVFVLGADAWNSLARWHRSEELCQRVSFWVFQRAEDAKATENRLLVKYANAQQGLAHPAGGYWLDDSVNVPVSSSAIRQSSHIDQQFLPYSVEQYIKQHKLYGDIQTEKE